MEKLHMQYDTIMNLDFYIFENILEHYSNILEERKKAEEEEMKKQGYDEKNMNPQNMMHQAQKNMPKMPNITVPKF
jgi:hypothetical protein